MIQNQSFNVSSPEDPTGRSWTGSTRIKEASEQNRILNESQRWITLMRRVSGMPGLQSCVADPMSTPLRRIEARTDREIGDVRIDTATR